MEPNEAGRTANAGFADRAFTACIARIPATAGTAFLAAFFAGLLTHAYMLFNKLPNHDDIIGTFTRNEMTSSGRWFLWAASSVSSRMSVPWVNGMIALVCLALVGAAAVWMLRFRSKTLSAAVGVLLVTFPTVANTFAYMFTVDAYMIALLLATVAAALTDRYRFGFLPAAVLLALSMGIYQAYVCFAIALLYIRFLCMLTEPDAWDVRALLRYALRCIAALAAGLLLYFVGLRCMLLYRNVELTTYQGIGNAAVASLADAAFRLYRPYYYFVTNVLYHNPLFHTFFARCVYVLSIFSSAGFCVFVCLRQKPLCASRLCLLFAALLLMPLTFNAVYAMGADAEHELMKAALSLVYVMPLALLDQQLRSEERLRRQRRASVVFWIACVLAASVSIQGAAYANTAYMSLQLTYESAYGLANRILFRIESRNDYVPNVTPVWISGNFSGGNYGTIIDKDAAYHAGTIAFEYGTPHRMLRTNEHFQKMYLYYFGVSIVAPSAEQIEKIERSEAFRDMPCYPAADSLRMIDGVLVVKAE